MPATIQDHTLVELSAWKVREIELRNGDGQQVSETVLVFSGPPNGLSTNWQAGQTTLEHAALSCAGSTLSGDRIWMRTSKLSVGIADADRYLIGVNFSGTKLSAADEASVLTKVINAAYAIH
jgi:hypothetical protein